MKKLLVIYAGKGFYKVQFWSKGGQSLIAGSQNLAKYFESWRPECYIFQLVVLLLFQPWHYFDVTVNVSWRTWRK